MQFIVVKQGVYIQDVYGPFNILRAIIKAQELAIADIDDWHSYDVREITKEGLSELKLYSFTKDGERIRRTANIERLGRKRYENKRNQPS